MAPTAPKTASSQATSTTTSTKPSSATPINAFANIAWRDLRINGQTSARYQANLTSTILFPRPRRPQVGNCSCLALRFGCEMCGVAVASADRIWICHHSSAHAEHMRPPDIPSIAQLGPRRGVRCALHALVKNRFDDPPFGDRQLAQLGWVESQVNTLEVNARARKATPWYTGSTDWPTIKARRIGNGRVSKAKASKK